MRASKWVVALGIASACVGTVAHADDTGIYAGGSVGRAESKISNDTLDSLLDSEDTAFKLFLGYRVLDWVGFEAEYVDLGEITGNTGSLIGPSAFRLEEAGFGVFGMLYWTPAPVPLDLFAKGGFVVSQAHFRSNNGLFAFDDTNNSTDLAWGVGAQFRFDKLAVRVEYEKFDLDAGPNIDAPDMISVGASWTFF